MNLGAFFPQTEFGNDPAAIRDFAKVARRPTGRLCDRNIS